MAVVQELLTLNKYKDLALQGRLRGYDFVGMTTLAVREGHEVRKRTKEFMTSLTAGALQRRHLVFPIEDQFTTHTYTLHDGRIVYSKGNKRPHHRRRALRHAGPRAVRPQPGGRGDGFLGASDDRPGVYLNGKRRLDACGVCQDNPL